MSLLTKDEANTRAASSEYLDEFVLTDLLVLQLMLHPQQITFMDNYGGRM